MSVAERRLAPWVFGAIVVLAAALRLPALDLRPMHTDESVHAAKFARLLEQGRYEYDPEEFHGPTLNYLTLIPARARGTARYADLDEITLRVVPALGGILLVAAHVLLVPVVGFRPAALAALLAAVSPAMVYYSRYYIQETLLVTFSFGALIGVCRYLQTHRLRWAIAAGTSLGLMFATKETAVIAFGSMAGGLAVARMAVRLRPADAPAPAPPADPRRAAVHLLAAAFAAIAISAVLFSSFFSHPRGIVDSIGAFSTYAARAGGAPWHIHPWHYYFGLLLFAGSDGGPIFTEAAIVGLALVGLGGIVTGTVVPGRAFVPIAFLGAYAVLMITVYALIPYKTPWCVLGFLHALILMAGVGGVPLLDVSPAPTARPLAAGLVGVAIVHLAWLAWAGSFRLASDPRNPWVYAHTGTDVFEIVRRVEVLSRAHPLRERMPIEVISGENLWPLPWYFRRHPAVRWETAPVDDGVNAPVILATPDLESAIVRKLYEWRQPGQRELYVPAFDRVVELRPQVELRGYAAKSLWDAASTR